MRAELVIHDGDFAAPKRTGNRIEGGVAQQIAISRRHVEGVDVTGYLSTAGVRRIANAWTVLAEQMEAE